MMTQILILIKDDLLSLGVISCLQNNLQNKVPNTVFQQVDSWTSLEDSQIKTPFDLLIIDSRFFDFSKITILERIRRRQPSLKTILLENENRLPFTVSLLKKGVIEGVCMKSISRQDFIHAYSVIMLGKKYLDNSMTEYLLMDLSETNRPVALSVRESQISNLLTQGLRTQEIAKKLSLAVSTVSTIKFNIYRKMGVSNIVELAAKMDHLPKNSPKFNPARYARGSASQEPE